MNQFPVSVDYPILGRVDVAKLSMQATYANGALDINDAGGTVSFDVNYTNVKSMLAKLTSESPVLEAKDLGTFNVNKYTAAELAAALVCVVADNEIGDLLEQYQPV